MPTIAQTSQLQQEIEAKLWLAWVWDRITNVAESPTGLFLVVLLVEGILLAWAVWLRNPRANRAR